MSNLFNMDSFPIANINGVDYIRYANKLIQVEKIIELIEKQIIIDYDLPEDGCIADELFDIWVKTREEQDIIELITDFEHINITERRS